MEIFINVLWLMWFTGLGALAVTILNPGISGEQAKRLFIDNIIRYAVIAMVTLAIIHTAINKVVLHIFEYRFSLAQEYINMHGDGLLGIAFEYTIWTVEIVAAVEIVKNIWNMFIIVKE